VERIRIPRIMQETSKKLLYKSKSIGFVPTMGALHEGHLSLIRRARVENNIVVVSIFVNPLQFGPKEDFDAYPRPIDRDIEILQKEQTDILFMPDAALMYAEGFCTFVEVEGLSNKLCGAFRPGHFRGVATVVCKLLNIVKPTNLYLGQKDYQQAMIIKRLCDDLNIDTNVVICRTVREPDGLAMSSRNLYLNEAERKAAVVISKTLTHISDAIIKGRISCTEVPSMMHRLLREEPLVSEVQYAGIFDPHTFEPLTEYKRGNLLAIALKIGTTRLIDNMLVEIK
jgi:pantoate--beta-alanine ligase